MDTTLRKRERAQIISILWGFRFQLFFFIAIIGIFLFLEPRTAHGAVLIDNSTPTQTVTNDTSNQRMSNVAGTYYYIALKGTRSTSQSTVISGSTYQGAWASTYIGAWVACPVTDLPIAPLSADVALYQLGTGSCGSFTPTPLVLQSNYFIGWSMAGGGTTIVYHSTDNTFDGDNSNNNAQGALAKDLWFQFTDSGGLTVPTDGITTTIEPTPDSVYLTNPVHFNGTYSNGIDNFYNIVQVSATTTALTSPIVFQYFLASTTGSDLTYSLTRNLPVTGMYGYEIRLIDTVGDQFQTPWVYGGSFGLATTTTETSDVFVTPVEITCGTGDLFCYMKKAFMWLLYPTESVKESFDDLKETLNTKPPVGYFYILKNNLTGLTATSSAQVAVVIPTNLKTVIFDPLDVALSSILWALFGFIFYKRVSKIHL